MVAVTISIPDFVSKQVSGVWLWVESPTTGLFERDAKLVFGQTHVGPNGESLDYVMTPTTGGQSMPFTANVSRDAANPDHVTLQLIFTRSEGAGYYRASSFNAAGESPLTDQILPL